MSQYEILPLFPNVVGITKIGREFTVKEKSVVEEAAKNTTKGALNNQSTDSFIFENNNLSGIKDFCYQSIGDYWEHVLKAGESSTPVITQSWINYSNQGESHHLHNHPNSMLSGVFYFAANNDFILFYRPLKPQLQVSQSEYNIFNSDTFSVPVNSGDCLIFPSYLEHSVPANLNNSTRISFSFNCLPSGVIGDQIGLTKATIKVIS